MGFSKPRYCSGSGVGGNVNGNNGYRPSIALTKPPERLISLIPSMTASLFDLGLGDRVVGVTEYCPQPQESGGSLPTVGGTRDPSVEQILALKPDLVLANQEENDRRTVEALEAVGVAVWVTFPRTVDQAIEILWALLNLIPSDSLASNKLLLLERSLEWARRSAQDQKPIQVFYPIWMDQHQGDPWFMTINANTYAHDVLRICGAHNVFAERTRRYPLEADLGLCQADAPGDRDLRYPRVTVGEVRTLAPALILLPDEPFSFGQDHIEQLCELFHDTPAGQSGNIYTVDGRLVNWHGTMVARAIAELPPLIQGFNR
jgi:ABC-type Fe3+-hydroxamate transport system substrate-binding protein